MQVRLLQKFDDVCDSHRICLPLESSNDLVHQGFHPNSSIFPGVGAYGRQCFQGNDFPFPPRARAEGVEGVVVGGNGLRLAAAVAYSIGLITAGA